MAVPLDPEVFKRPMDPRDTAFFAILVTQGSEDTDTLAPGEGIASFELALTAEAVAAGMQFRTDGGYSIFRVGLTIYFWVQFDPAVWGSAIFDAPGIMLGVELTITTDSSPAAIKQRTSLVQAVQR